MNYFGGKSRVAKDISGILNEVRKEDQLFLSPFVGGGWVEQYIDGKKILCDKHEYLIAMYKALQEGWTPPTELSREDYQHIKDNPDEKPHLTGFVGFGCSFAGKWFGGYAKDNSGRNYCLNAYNSLNKKIANGLLKNSYFDCVDYKELNPEGFLIYCDPPYANTTTYDRKLVGKFNHEEFWDIMRKWSKYNDIYISSYTAPTDFRQVWCKYTKLDIRTKKNPIRVEKLFTL